MNLRDLFQNLDRSAIEKWCRAQTQQAYLGDNTALARVLGKFLMYVDTRDLSLTPHLLMNGYWEMWVTQAIVDYVKPGMRCIDVGANVGYYTLLLADLVGGDGSLVTAYEPQLDACALMGRSGCVNGFPFTKLRQQAASDSVHSAKLYTHHQLSGSASLQAFRGGKETESIETVSLDSLKPDPVDFMKIDVQGHELGVLRGMPDLIARSPKIAIAMEFSPSEHPDPAAALVEIQAMGLKIQTIGTDGVVRPVTLEDAAQADTGDHRMLWLTRV
jgi:FkbM family methyltransferase